MPGKKVLIVISHPEPTSFSHALANTAKQTFEAQGDEVKVSDLFAMKFDPVNDRRNFTTVKNAERYHQAQEETYAVENKGFNSDLQAEMDKLSWCDLLIFQCPIHWFSIPAMLKGWVDKVFAFNFAYGFGRWYDKGIFEGKKALICITTGAPEFMYKNDGIQGDIHEVLFPINHGVFFFCGMTALRSHIVYSPSHVNQEQRQEMLTKYEQFIKNIDNAPQYHYRTLADVNSGSGVISLPTNATHMITTVNAMMKAWAENDEELYRKCVDTDKIKMVIPAYGLDVTGVAGIWGVRQSMGAAPLNPHVNDTHTFPPEDPDSVQFYAHVIDKTTGQRVQLSSCRVTFDASHMVAVKYHQENLFIKQ